MFDIADRLEIVNLLGAYSHYYDGGEFNAWIDLFTDDAVFEFLGAITGTFTGRDGILQISSPYSEALAEGGPGRHLMTNVTVLEQTSTTAKE